MRITRKRLTEIIHEELGSLLELSDGSDEPKKAKKKGGTKPDLAASDEDPTRPASDVPDGGTVKSPDASPVPPGKSSERGPDVQKLDGDETDPSASPEDQADAEHDEEDAIDAGGDAAEEPSGAINDEVSGKTVQAVTIEPKSKVLPGAKEVVLAFNESTDALRILVTPTGAVKFFWRGQLHDLP